jgi:phage antirepressor YoqD-like protein
MAISANQLLQAYNDAVGGDQAQATRLFRILLQQALLIRQAQLAMKAMSDVGLTAAEKAELASNETALANLAGFIG